MPDSHRWTGWTGFFLSILNILFILFIHVQKFLIVLSPLWRRQPWRRSRLIQVGEMAEAVPGLVRAGRPRSREAIIP